MNPSCFVPRIVQRLKSADSGIAIGPILFIIAILGILAAAIAAGSGSFTSGTSSAGNRAKASALVDIGQNLKIGFDRTISNGTEFGSVIIDPAQTNAEVDMFSPTGGGIVAPGVSMAATPSSAHWYYPTVTMGGVGTARLAALQITLGVCDELNMTINTMAAGSATTASAAIGDLSAAGTLTWPAAYNGKLIGCVHNSDATGSPAGYYFYQVLGVQ